ncbi:MAG: extracellular solute-binding protein [Treponema sp.]|jgi:putative aldouronate transport system substrate-binding protein|nr:extracellular solute-binding protein [Treponema sp.]
MTRLGSTEAPAPDNAVIREIERLTNAKLEIQYIPDYPERLNVTVASNDLPMVTLFPGGDKPSVVEVDSVRAGLFWKIGDYINNYEWLRQLDESTIQNATVDGELWGMFRTRPVVRNGLFYRSDWAENLGLSKPKNLEDLYKMLKAFVENDPDGNGKKDTYGLAQESYLRLVFAALSPAFGLGNNYDIAGGKLVATHLQPGYLEMLKFIKRLYDEGLMNRDFPTISEAQRDEMMADNYGMAITSIDKGEFAIVSLQKLHPEANFTVMVDFEDVKAPILGRSGFESKFYVSKKAVPQEADFIRIMEYFNVMHSPEVNNLVYNGFENIHYTKTGSNTISVSDEQRAKYNLEVLPVEQVAFRFIKNNFDVENNHPYTAQVQSFYKSYPGPVIGDPTQPLASETLNEKGNELQQLIWDAGVQFVTGSIDDRGWQAALERWRQDGGDKMSAEYQKEYDANLK